MSRARTIRAAVAPETRRSDLVVPGYVFPVQARNGGVLVRSARLEATVDLARIAGFRPGGVICQILEEDGSVALMPYLEGYAARHKLKIASIADLIAYRLRSECLVKRIAEVDFGPAEAGADGVLDRIEAQLAQGEGQLPGGDNRADVVAFFDQHLFGKVQVLGRCLG